MSKILDGIDTQEIWGEAHEIWGTAQLTPNEGIEDGVLRIVRLLGPIYQDARRYRWLREYHSMKDLPYPTPPWCVRGVKNPLTQTEQVTGPVLDAAIDTVIAKKQGETK